jgi:hypothetical protein
MNITTTVSTETTGDKLPLAARGGHGSKVSRKVNESLKMAAFTFTISTIEIEEELTAIEGNGMNDRERLTFEWMKERTQQTRLFMKSLISNQTIELSDNLTLILRSVGFPGSEENDQN